MIATDIPSGSDEDGKSKMRGMWGKRGEVDGRELGAMGAGNGGPTTVRWIFSGPGTRMHPRLHCNRPAFQPSPGHARSPHLFKGHQNLHRGALIPPRPSFSVFLAFNQPPPRSTTLLHPRIHGFRCAIQKIAICRPRVFIMFLAGFHE
jgi:hypothetical protein